MATTNGIELPRDQYAHVGAPSEWWWHIGTLRSGDRVFGFEVNATGRPDQNFGFTQIMVSDIANQAHYQATSAVAPLPADWAESDASKTWSVAIDGTINIGTYGNGKISMKGAPGNCFDMQVDASFEDATTGTPVSLSVRFVQDGQPLLVWGTGMHEVNPEGKTPLERNNYYYSFTRICASGTLTIDGQSHEVEGQTWMDHEYGYFGQDTNWVLQDMQLDNGVHLSTFAINQVPQAGVPYDSFASILWPDGNTTFVKSTTTPQGPTWTSPEGVDYCLTMELAIEDLPATLTVTSLLADQEFEIPQKPIYEGVASAAGIFAGQEVTGTAWLEQKIKPGGRAGSRAAMAMAQLAG